MENKNRIVVSAQMNTRSMPEWNRTIESCNHTNKKMQLRNVTISAAAFLCLGVASFSLVSGNSIPVQVTTDFEYDNTLGRLQFVSSLIPESAMVFMQSDMAEELAQPANGQMELHVWSVEEPWIEVACYGEIHACDDATVMTVVKNRAQTYTVRLMHENGYESVYSGLGEVSVKEGEYVMRNASIGYADGTAAFEYRKDGMSIYPVFSPIEE